MPFWVIPCYIFRLVCSCLLVLFCSDLSCVKQKVKNEVENACIWPRLFCILMGHQDWAGVHGKVWPGPARTFASLWDQSRSQKCDREFQRWPVWGLALSPTPSLSSRRGASESRHGRRSPAERFRQTSSSGAVGYSVGLMAKAVGLGSVCQGRCRIGGRKTD